MEEAVSWHSIIIIIEYLFQTILWKEVFQGLKINYELIIIIITFFLVATDLWIIQFLQASIMGVCITAAFRQSLPFKCQVISLESFKILSNVHIFNVIFKPYRVTFESRAL